MLLKICLILAILAGGGVIAVNFVMVKPAIVTTIAQRDKEKTDKEDAQKKLRKSQSDLATANNNLTATKKDLTQTQAELKTARNSVEELKTANGDLTTRLNEAASKRDSLQAELIKWNQLQLSPEGVIKLEEDLKKSVLAVAARDTENKLLNKNLQEVKDELKRLQGTSSVVVEPPGLSGQVVAVDPKYGFVILNIGSDKNVVANGTLLISRGGKFIGHVQVARVGPTQCVANILPDQAHPSGLAEVMEGDVVFTPAGNAL